MNYKLFTLLLLMLGLCVGGGCKKSSSKQKQAGPAQSGQSVQTQHVSLHEAASSGNIAWMQVLLNQGADPNERSADGHTPLCVAIRSGNARSVAFLLQNGADRNELEEDGSPLWVEYAGRMTPEIMKFMLPGDAPAEQVYQALELAISYNPDERTVDLLLEKAQTFPDFASRCFWPAALESENQTVVDSLLIRNIIPVNGCAHSREDPPLVEAVKRGNQKLIASLMLLGANATLRDSAGYTASYYAVRAGDKELASRLVAEEERIRAEEYAAVLARKRAAARKRAGSGGCFIRKADGSTVPCPGL